MAIALTKGGNISLSKEAPSLKNILVGLGWDARAQKAGAAFDLDASCFMLAADGKVLSDTNFIFYNKPKSDCDSVEHAGDNRTGKGEGDDEVIFVRLEKVPSEIQKLTFVVTIHEAGRRRQNFSMINSTFIRVVNMDNNKTIVKFDISEIASTNTAMILGEVYRHGNEWKFKAVGQGFDGGLRPLARNFGINI